MWRDLPDTLPFIARYFIESAPDRALANARASWPLIERSLDEHDSLAEAAGADGLLRRSGWLKAFRTQETLDEGLRDAEKIRPFGMRFDLLDRAALQAIEPQVAGPIGAIHYRDPVSCIDPGGLTKAYAALFVARGGRFVAGDARSLTRNGASWRVATNEGPVEAREALVALGPWADDIFRPLGFKIPLGVKRGYHMHYAPAAAGAKAVLGHPILDADNGYLLAPMRAGIRLTTGAEFARRDRPPSPVQIAQCEPMAREMVPLGKRVDAQPWLGRRPCLPDLLPVIGPAPGQPGLWFDFGHQHHGFTLGPVTGTADRRNDDRRSPLHRSRTLSPKPLLIAVLTGFDHSSSSLSFGAMPLPDFFSPAAFACFSSRRSATASLQVLESFARFSAMQSRSLPPFGSIPLQ